MLAIYFNYLFGKRPIEDVLKGRLLFFLKKKEKKEADSKQTNQNSWPSSYTATYTVLIHTSIKSAVRPKCFTHLRATKMMLPSNTLYFL